MTLAHIVTIASNACAMLISALLLVGAILGGRFNVRINRLFIAMLILSFTGSFAELFYDFLVDVESNLPNILQVIVGLADYLIAGIYFAVFCIYLHEFLSSKDDRPISRKPFIIMACIYVLNIPLVILSDAVLHGFLDEQARYEQDFIQAASAIPILVVIMMIAVTLRTVKRQKIKAREWTSLLAYMLIPLLGLFIEYINPDIWLTYLGGTISLFLIYVNIQLELKQQILKQEIELGESRISVMLSQIQPHFLYNSLSAIEDLCDVDIEKTKTAVNDFAHYLRGNLESVTQKRMIPFEDELEHVETYLLLEKLRFGDKLNLVFDIEASDFPVPPLSVQPMAENAVRHGIMKKSGNGTVAIRSRSAENAHIIIVEDNGAGFDLTGPIGDERIHIGIENVRERLKAMCGGTLEIISAPGKGTKAVITIPNSEEAPE